MNLSERLNKINNSLGTVGEGKVDLATMLLETKVSEHWPSTTYKSWKNFCSTEVALSHSAIYVYLNTAQLAKDNNFRITDMKYIVQAIGWSRLRIGLSKLVKSEPVNVITFIKMFKDLNLNQRVTYEDSDSSLVNFTFSIPQKYADTLTNELLVRGMRMTNKSRSNMSSAMVKLVKELLV
tara:strand:- start:8645 stop:9184 length:540 start_codon:yes stop_codon:yes gene_type:complete